MKIHTELPSFSVEDFIPHPLTFKEAAPLRDFHGVSVSWVSPSSIGSKNHEDFFEWVSADFSNN
jgi:hypothetical protein